MNVTSCPAPKPGLDGNPLDMSSAQLVQLACGLARVASVLCDVGGVGSDQASGLPRVGPAGVHGWLTPASLDQPYIWDCPEED